MEQKRSDMARKLRLDVADSVYSEMDIERNVRIFKEEQKNSLLLRQYGKSKENKAE